MQWRAGCDDASVPHDRDELSVGCSSLSSMADPDLHVDLVTVDTDDFEALAALRVETMRDSLEHIGRFDPARARERLRTGFSPGDTRHIIVGGQRVGFVVAKAHGGALLLEHLYLRPDAQRRGIGASVLGRIFAEADARTRAVRVTALRASAANGFYAAHGFQLVAGREFDNDYERPAMCRTSRLTLRPATIALARAEIDDRAGFARQLGAIVPDNWPPASIVDALPLFLAWMEAAPAGLGWFAWHALAVGTAGAASTLVGSGGFTGPPQAGVVNIGYSVLPQFQGRGYATEIAGGLVQWALRQPGVTCVAAETEWANPASVRVLSKAGFIPAGTAAGPAGARFELTGTINRPG